MSENLYCDDQRTLSNTGKYNWYRTFKGYPDLNEEIWKMLTEFDATKLLLFFIKYVTEDKEYANFLTNELLTGRWNSEKNTKE